MHRDIIGRVPCREFEHSAKLGRFAIAFSLNSKLQRTKPSKNFVKLGYIGEKCHPNYGGKRT